MWDFFPGDFLPKYFPALAVQAEQSKLVELIRLWSIHAAAAPSASTAFRLSGSVRPGSLG